MTPWRLRKPSGERIGPTTIELSCRPDPLTRREKLARQRVFLLSSSMHRGRVHARENAIPKGRT